MANAGIDDNFTRTLLALSNSDGRTIVALWANPVTHALLVELTSASIGLFIDNEVVSGSATTFTLAQTPISGSEHIYAAGQRLTPGSGNDYTISGAVITTANTFSAGDILADYRYNP